MIDIVITEEILNIQQCINKVQSDDCGGIDVFIGTVRDNTKGKKVLRLEFEAYETMALIEMRKLAKNAVDKWSLKSVLIYHRTGILHVGDVPVIIAVAAAHRDAAFDACRYLIDTLKQTVPIWKKEIFEDGDIWVSAHP
ncbi:MAG: molybdenum cofactor biosynthesis protein MoaE [Bacteroidota bacterium]